MAAVPRILLCRGTQNEKYFRQFLQYTVLSLFSIVTNIVASAAYSQNGDLGNATNILKESSQQISELRNEP
jgi:type IV secretory pathway VirB10-like protein